MYIRFVVDNVFGVKDELDFSAGFVGTGFVAMGLVHFLIGISWHTTLTNSMMFGAMIFNLMRMKLPFAIRSWTVDLES